jgi:hypothetical protein
VAKTSRKDDHPAKPGEEFTLVVPPPEPPSVSLIRIEAPFQARCRWVGDDHVLAVVAPEAPIRLSHMPRYVGQLYFQRRGGEWSLVREYTALAYATVPDKVKECNIEGMIAAAVIAALKKTVG